MIPARVFFISSGERRRFLHRHKGFFQYCFDDRADRSVVLLHVTVTRALVCARPTRASDICAALVEGTKNCELLEYTNH